MNEKHTYTLLKVINNNSNVRLLLRDGLTFPRIAELTSDLIKIGYIIHSEEKIMLSAKGLEKLWELEVKFKKINKKEWIEKDKLSMIPRLENKIIFVPKQNELTFLVLWKNTSSTSVE